MEDDVGAAPAAQQRRGNKLLASLGAADLSLLAPHLAEQRLERETILFEAGAPITHVYFPHHGVISLLIVSREGASIEAGTVGNEGVVGLGGLLAKDVSFTRQIVQLSGSASMISRRPFLEAITASGTLRQRFSVQADRFTGQVLQSAACHALHSAEQRLARWLLETEDRWEDDELPVTQDLLATVLGVRRATISVAANTLQSMGVISYRRGRILIRDRATLENMACECYAIIKELHESPFGCEDRS